MVVFNKNKIKENNLDTTSIEEMSANKLLEVEYENNILAKQLNQQLLFNGLDMIMKIGMVVMVAAGFIAFLFFSYHIIQDLIKLSEKNPNSLFALAPFLSISAISMYTLLGISIRAVTKKNTKEEKYQNEPNIPMVDLVKRAAEKTNYDSFF